jgi:hypothetical protein
MSPCTVTDEIYTDAESKFQPGEGIPDMANVNSILREMEQAISEVHYSAAIFSPRRADTLMVQECYSYPTL